MVVIFATFGSPSCTLYLLFYMLFSCVPPLWPFLAAIFSIVLIPVFLYALPQIVATSFRLTFSLVIWHTCLQAPYIDPNEKIVHELWQGFNFNFFC